MTVRRIHIPQENPDTLYTTIKFISEIGRSLEERRRGEANGSPTPLVLPGESHGHRSLVGYGPWSHKESLLSTDTQSLSHFLLLTPSTVTVIHTHTRGKRICHPSLKLIIQGLHRKQDAEKEASASLGFQGYCFGCWKFLHWLLAKNFFQLSLCDPHSRNGAVFDQQQK